jgi:putative flippase GtrA
LKIVTTLYRQVEHLVHEVAKFGLVGLLGMVVDLPIYNWLVFDNPLVFGASEHGMLHDKPVTAKFISVTIATIATYLGNRHWTWRHRERTGLHREYVLFFVLNGIGLLIAAGCLGFSRYVLDQHSWLADNIAASSSSRKKSPSRKPNTTPPTPPSTQTPPATSPPSADPRWRQSPAATRHHLRFSRSYEILARDRSLSVRRTGGVERRDRDGTGAMDRRRRRRFPTAVLAADRSSSPHRTR